MANSNPQFTFETQQMTKTEFLRGALARLQDDVGTILDLIVDHNSKNPRPIGFWPSVRMLMPIVESIGRVVDEEPWEFLENHLDVTTPNLAWQMFRHSLTHGDLMHHAELQGERVSWGIHLDGNRHIIKSGQLDLDMKYLYEKLVEYLQTEIAKNDQTIVSVPVGVIYQNPEPYIIDDFNKLKIEGVGN